MNVPAEPSPELPPTTDVRVGGQTCRVRRLGSGPRLLLLHGGPGLDHHVLLPLAYPLAQRFEVWLVDLPGHGAAEPDEGPLPSLQQLYERLADWLRHLEGGVDFLGGHSLGAWLVRELLRRKVVAPRAAVLLSPPASTVVAGGPQLHPLFLLTGPGEPGEARGEFLQQLLQEMDEPPSDDFLQALELARLRRPTAYGALLRELDTRLSKRVPSCAPGCPVLVLGGHRDTTTPPAAAAAVTAATEGARLRLLRDCGHFPWAYGDTQAAREIQRFLDEVSPGSAG